jgi:D-lactate dehydrogenase
MKIAFFDAKPYDREVFNRENETYGYKIKYFETKLTVDSVALTRGFDVVCVFVNDVVNKAVIRELIRNDIKMIALRCAGFNNVDIIATRCKIPVVRVPAYSPHAIAEYTVSLILALNRKIYRAYQRTRESNFSLNGLIGFDMYGKTAGIIGTGKIGVLTIGILKGFGMRVLACDPYPKHQAAEKYGFTYTDLETLYRESHIVSLHCPLTEDTEYIINEKSLALMKEGVMIINTGRGKLVDTRALIRGLKKGKVGYAGLDVYEEERDFFFEDQSDMILTDDVLARLLTFNNVVITSHQGFFTREALESIAQTTLGNIRELEEDKPFSNQVSCDS